MSSRKDITKRFNMLPEPVKRCMENTEKYCYQTNAVEPPTDIKASLTNGEEGCAEFDSMFNSCAKEFVNTGGGCLVADVVKNYTVHYCTAEFTVGELGGNKDGCDAFNAMLSRCNQVAGSDCSKLCRNFIDYITKCVMENRVMMCPRGPESVSCYKKYTEHCTELWNDKFVENFPSCGNFKELCNTNQHFSSLNTVAIGIVLIATAVSLVGCYYHFQHPSMVDHAHNE